MFFRSILCIILLLHLSAGLYGQVKVSGNSGHNKISFMMTGSTDISKSGQEKWLGVLIESVLEFKCRNISGLDYISIDQAILKTSDLKTEKILTDQNYSDIAKRLNVNFIGKAKYELSPNKNVFYYLEIISTQKNTSIVVDREFKLDKIGSELDVITNEILQSLKLNPSSDLVRFLKFPIVSSDSRNLRLLGESMLIEQNASSGDVSKLIDNYRIICSKDRTMLLAFWQAGFLFEKAGYITEALEAFKNVYHTFPEYDPAYVAVSRLNRKANRPQDAFQVIAKGEQRNENNTELLVEKALLLQATDKKYLAEATFKKILSADPDNDIALLQYAKMCNDEGRAAEAVELCNRYFKTKSESADIFFELGRGLISLKNKEGAINAFLKAIKLDPKNYLACIALADLYSSINSYANAAKYYENAIQLSKENVDLYVNAARALQKSGNSDGAYELLRKIESRYPDHSSFNRELGFLELAKKDTSRARLHLERAMKNNPRDDEQILLELGWIYTNNNEFDKALPLFLRALPLVKDKKSCKTGLANIYLGRNEFAPAIQILQELSIQKVTIPGAFKKIADHYYSKGNKNEALQFFRKELQLNKTDTAVLSKVAEITFANGVWIESRNAYLEYTRYNNSDPLAFYRLAIISLKLKDKVAASTYVSKALAKGKTDAETFYGLGVGFKELNSPLDAVNMLQKSASEDRKHEKALLQLASLYETLKKDSAAAEIHMQLFAVNNDKYKQNLIVAGKLFERKNLKQNAKDAYYLFIKKKYINPEANIRLTKIEYESNNFDSVASLLQNIPPDRLEISMLRIGAEAFFKLQQYKKVISYASVILQKLPSDARAIELCAVAYDKNGANESAVKMYRKYISLSGDYKSYGFRVGEIYEQLQYSKMAIDFYESALKSNSQDSRIYERLARLYYKSNDWKNAAINLNKATASKNSDPELYLYLARASSKVNDISGAVESYKKYLQFKSNDSVLVELGLALYNQKDYKGAVESLTKVSPARNGNYDVLKCIGLSYGKIGDLQKATDPLERAFELKNTDKEVIMMLADCYRSGRNQYGLETALRALCILDKRDLVIRKELADLLFSLSKDDDAISILEEIIALKPCEVDLRLKLAKTYETQKKRIKWGEHLIKALQCAPNNPDINYQMSVYYESQKDTAKAMVYLRQTLKLSETHNEANYKMGQMLLAGKNFDQAIKYLSKTVKSDSDIEKRLFLTEAFYRSSKTAEALSIVKPLLTPDCNDPRVFQWAGFLFKETGNKDSAIQILEKAVKTNSKCGRCFSMLGDLYYENADYSNAINSYLNANEINGFNEVYAMRLGRAYSALGNENLARQMYENILVKYPRNAEVLFRLSHSYFVTGQSEPCRSIAQRLTNKKSGWYNLIMGEILELEKNYDEAINSYIQASLTLSEMHELQAGLGRCSLKKGNFNDAVEFFAKAMAGDPENYQYLLGMGKAYEGLRDYQAALELYKEVRRKKPGDREVESLIAKLQR